jgi:DNA polymerase III subunit gamma/tau
LSLYQKYRPKTLKDVHGNRLLLESLESMLDAPEKMSHAIMFTGPSGCGKTTLAYIIKDTLKCGEHDFTEADAAGFEGGVEYVRELRRKMTLRPISGPVRVYLLDECHLLGTGGDSPKNIAQNALLKALEQTPKHVYFILCTTDPQRVLKTIRTRCIQFSVTPLSSRLMTKLLNNILDSENKSGAVSEDVMELICKESLGSPRSAINALQKVMDLAPRLQAQAVEKAMSDENETIELCRALIAGKNWAILKMILKGLQEQEPESVRRAVLGYCNSILLGEDSARAVVIIREFQYPTYDSGWPSLTAACYMVMEAGK